MVNKQQLTVGIACLPTMGGSGTVATELGRELARRGHQVHFVSYDVPFRFGDFTENIYFHQVTMGDHPVFRFPPYSLALASKLFELTEKAGLDIIHAHYALPHAVSACLARQLVQGGPSPRLITTLHGTDITLVARDRSYLPLTQFGIRESDAVTTPSYSLRATTYEVLELPEDRPIEVISNFVDTDMFRPASSSEREEFRGKLAGQHPAKKIIAHISNFRPVKRVCDVVRTFQLIQQHIDAHLLFVGDGPERGKVESLVAELRLTAKVCFLGNQNCVEQILRGCNLLLLPSERESFGLAALEAMSSGVPVVGSAIDGLPEVVVDGETGYLRPVGAVGLMAERAIALLGDEELHATYRRQARSRAVQHFEKKMQVNRYEELYFRTLGR